MDSVGTLGKQDLLGVVVETFDRCTDVRSRNNVERIHCSSFLRYGEEHVCFRIDSQPCRMD